MQLFLQKNFTVWNWVAAYHTRLPDNDSTRIRDGVPDLGIISDMLIFFDAYQYDTDKMQI